MKLKVGIVLFCVGMLGVLSMLNTDIPLPEELKEKLLVKLTENQLKMALLINPTILLSVSTVVGVLLFDKCKFDVPILKNILGEKSDVAFQEMLKSGLIGGVLAGILLFIIAKLYNTLLPQEFLILENQIEPAPLVRFLYGGVTEEILMRFGLMTFITWLVSKALDFKSITYWIAILLSSLVFAIGHFPIVYQNIPSPSNVLLSYILIGNSVGGLIFGWLYWKKGLESSMIAHAMAHFILIVLERV